MTGSTSFLWMICNPVAGRGKAAGRGLALQRELVDAGLQCHLEMTEHRGHASVLVRRAIARGSQRLVVVGGDGTMHEAVQGLFAAGDPPDDCVAVAYAGGGTSCDFMKVLPPNRRPVERIGEWVTRRQDLIRADCHDEAGRSVTRYAVNSSNIGIIAEASSFYESGNRVVGLARRISTDVGMVTAGVGAIVRHRGIALSVAADDADKREALFSNLAMVKTPWIGGGMRLDVPTTVDGGAGVLCTVEAAGASTLLRSIAALYRGRIARHPTFRWQPCVTASVGATTPRVVEADGEIIGLTPVRYEVLPRALRVVV